MDREITSRQQAVVNLLLVRFGERESVCDGLNRSVCFSFSFEIAL